MPTARIITSMPELSGGLVRDLNSRGFEVHILSPSQVSSGEVDLEIRLEISASESVAASIPLSSLVAQPEDIWAMLTAFDGDAQDIIAAQPPESGPQETCDPAPKADSDSLQDVAPEKTSSTSAEIISEPLDPELVPSMFGLGAFDGRSRNQNGATTSEVEVPAYPGFANANKNSLDSRLAKAAAAAAGCAVVVILLALTFAHRRSPLPTAVNSTGHEATAQVPFHSSTTASASVVPVKAVITSDATATLKTAPHGAPHDASIAEDTIVHFGSAPKARRTPAEKQAGVRYYSDMD